MHIIIGDLYDPFCREVYDSLKDHNEPVLVISNPLIHPCSFEWRLNNQENKSRLVWNSELSFSDDEIDSVFVRNSAWIDPDGWQKDDLMYMQSETHAALLAWFWSLSCPVINRYSPAIWYRPKAPLLFWQPLLRHNGLRTLETIITNVPEEAGQFRKKLMSREIGGAVFSSLSSDLSYLVADTNEWDGLAQMQRYSPVCLVAPHGEPKFVCVIGDHVIWDDKTFFHAKTLEPSLIAFAKESELSLVELAITTDNDEYNVIAVEPFPTLEHFKDDSKDKIVKEVISLLTSKEKNRRNNNFTFQN